MKVASEPLSRWNYHELLGWRWRATLRRSSHRGTAPPHQLFWPDFPAFPAGSAVAATTERSPPETSHQTPHRRDPMSH